MCNLLRIIILIVFTIFISGIVFVASLSAQGRDKTYNRIVNVSTKIVRGTIIGREEIRYDYDGVNMRCGYVLDINTKKSWKGGDSNFKVFVSNSDILMNNPENTEYFIFARRNSNFGKSKIEFINCDQGRSTRMDTSGFEFLATRITQQIFPIVSYSAENPITDEDTGVIKRGDWMMIVDRIANNALPFTIARRRLNNGNENVIEEMNLSDFLYEFKLE